MSNIPHDTLYEEVRNDILESKNYISDHQFYDLFERYSFSFGEALDVLIVANTCYSMYVFVQIIGNKDVRERFGWRDVVEDDIKNRKKYTKTATKFGVMYGLLLSEVNTHVLSMKSLSKLEIPQITLYAFIIALNKRIRKLQSPCKKNKYAKGVKSLTSKYNQFLESQPHSVAKTGNAYEDYEYGLSDWN